MKIFNIEPFDDPIGDDDSIDIKIIDFDSDGEGCCEGCDVRIFIPGPPGPVGPAGPQGPAGPAGTSRPTKTGLITGASFSGTPKKHAVVFSAAYFDANYVIALSGTDSRSYTYESKSPAGFTVNSNADAAIVGELSWITMTLGET